MFDSSVVSLTVVIDFWGYADLDLTATRGQFDPKGSLVLPLLNSVICSCSMLFASDETTLPLSFLFFLTFSELFFLTLSFVTTVNLRVIASNLVEYDNANRNILQRKHQCMVGESL